MEIKVTNREVTSNSAWIALDITITHNGEEKDLELSVEYTDMPNFGTTEIHWTIANGDESILKDNDLSDQIDDFVQEYVYANIGKF